MKTANKPTKYIGKMLRGFVVSEAIYAFIFIIVYLFFDIILNGRIAVWLTTKGGVSEHSIQLLYSNKELYLLALFMLGAFIIACFHIYKVAKGTALICKEMDGILDKNRTVGQLPDNLKAIELKLTDIKYNIERNEQLAKEAEQRKNDLVVYLAHDLKTPLTSVIGYLSILNESNDLPIEQREKYLGISLNKAYRLEQLINEFFEITRYNLQSIILENNRVDLTMLLYQIAEEFYPALEEKGQTITTNIEQDLLLIADADKLARVFDNILKNAISYSYENTNIHIEAYTDNDKIIINIKNIGDKIPEEKIGQIFEKFYRADWSRGSKQGGAGLGLAIAKHIVELHGGSISVNSTNAVTEFRVILNKNISI